MIALNLGCGFDYRDGWVNVDVRDDVKADIVSSLTKLPFPNRYADYVLLQDVLEHFHKLEQDVVLKEINRVLKIGGTFDVRVPDVEHIIRKFTLGHFEKIEHILGYLYGNQENIYRGHKFGFTQPILVEQLEKYGFKVESIGICDAINMRCVAKKVK